MHKVVRYVLPIILILFTSLILSISCADGTVSSISSDSSTTTSTSDTGYHISFFLNGKQVASLGLIELHTLPEVTLSIPGAGSDEQGPTLLSVLELAGIKNFSKVTISGMLKGRIATGELTLNRGDITGEVILDFNNQGKTKLCGSQIPDSNWIIDVAEIHAE